MLLNITAKKNPDPVPVPDVTTSKPQTSTKNPVNEYNLFCWIL